MTTTVVPASSAKWVLPFAATLIAMFTLQLSNLGFSPLLPSIQQEFGMSYTQLGFFTGLYGLLAMLLSVPAGISAKRFGETRRSLELTHKNIVRIYDFVHDNISGCISMEYVNGDTLSNAMSHVRTRLPDAEVAPLDSTLAD